MFSEVKAKSVLRFGFYFAGQWWPEFNFFATGTHAVIRGRSQARWNLNRRHDLMANFQIVIVDGVSTRLEHFGTLRRRHAPLTCTRFIFLPRPDGSGTFCGSSGRENFSAADHFHRTFRGIATHPSCGEPTP
jgi:hypothetical protein